MSSNRKELVTLGRKRKPDYVRVIRETAGRSLVRVLWSEAGRSRTESFDDTRKGLAEARAFAEGTHERLQQRKPADIAPISLHALYAKYLVAVEDKWAPNTLRLSTARWSKFELYAGKHTPAGLVTRETLDGFKRAMLANEHAPNQVRLAIKAATAVFRWAVDRDLIPPTKVVTYTAEFSKAVLRSGPKMSEFAAVDRTKVLAHLDPRDARQWRAYVLTTLFAYCGPRQTAGRSLEWSDIDLAAGVIHWRPETDKMGTERLQPMPEPVREAFWIAYGWRVAAGYAGPFVFFRPAKGRRRLRSGHANARAAARAAVVEDRPYTYQAYIEQLHAAERRAGLTPVKYRGAHGFRRGIAGDVHARTGSEKSAADWIGDKSVKIVREHYLLGRAEELQKTADLVSANPHETQSGVTDAPSETR